VVGNNNNNRKVFRIKKNRGSQPGGRRQFTENPKRVRGEKHRKKTDRKFASDTEEIRPGGRKKGRPGR